MKKFKISKIISIFDFQFVPYEEEIEEQNVKKDNA